MTDLTRYPLCWPADWKRTPGYQRKSPNFGKNERRYSSDGSHSWNQKKALTAADAAARVVEELERLRIKRDDMLISTNVRTRIDGQPRSDEPPKDGDPGVAVYWETKSGERRCMAIDAYNTVAGNIAAVAATLEALRAVERHGGAAILDRAFTGFTALPAPGQEAFSWRDVLGVDRNERDVARITAQYRRVRSEAHPDRPHGSAERFNAIEQAWEQAQKEIGR